MALADMYQITYDMTQFGRTMLMVFHVLRTSAIETAGSINDGFANSILPTLRLAQVDSVVSNETRIFNLETTTDFGTFSLSAAPGLRTGADSPSFIAVTQRYPTRDRDIKSGFKRFPGTIEEDYSDGVIGPIPLALFDANGVAIIGDWLSSIDAHIICNYVIIKRICQKVDPVTDECLEYRLPETNGELVFYQPNTFLTNPDISSQVSRKVF